MSPVALGIGIGIGFVPSGSPLAFRYAAGDSLATLGATFTRASNGTQSDANGVLQTALTNVARDGHYINGVRTLLLESQRTNSRLQSHDLTNASWTKSGTGSVTQNAVGLDGTAASATTVTDADAAAFYFASQAVTIPNDSATHAVVVWIRKDAIAARFVGIEVSMQGGAPSPATTTALNTQTGAITPYGATVGTATVSVRDRGLWWGVHVAITNNASGATSLTTKILPAVGTVFGTSAAAATGSCVGGQVQVELNGTFTTSPIFTTTTAVTRSVDALSFLGVQGGLTATLFQRYYDLATAAFVDAVSAYTSGTTITPTVDRAYQTLAVLRGSYTAGQAAAILGVP